MAFRSTFRSGLGECLTRGMAWHVESCKSARKMKRKMKKKMKKVPIVDIDKLKPLTRIRNLLLESIGSVGPGSHSNFHTLPGERIASSSARGLRVRATQGADGAVLSMNSEFDFQRADPFGICEITAAWPCNHLQYVNAFSATQ